MKNKLFVLFIMLVCQLCNAATIVMLDGQKITTDIYDINRTHLFYTDNETFYRIAIADIEYLTTGSDDYGYCEVNVYFSDNTRKTVEIVKFNSTCLLYKLPNVASELYAVKSADIVSMSKFPKSDKQSITNYQDVTVEQAQNIRFALSNVLRNLTEDATFDFVEIDSSDFYDKLWLQFYKYLSMETNNLFWDLIEVYSQKEKTLTDIYNEKLFAINKTELSMQEISTELQNRIFSLRQQFLWRAYKLINCTSR